MAKGVSLLSSPKPTTICTSQTHIGHVQLRDLIICPRQRGVVNYINQQAIIEHDLNVPNSTPHNLIDLHYTPNTLSSLPVHDSDQILLAAGGQEAEIHLSLHDSKRNTKPSWRLDDQLHASINNSVLLTSMNLARSNESSVEPKIVVSNNDCTVKFYDVPLRVRNPHKLDKDVGSLRLNVPVNHSSISPDGMTLLSVGDSSNVFLHRISGGSRLSFTPITTLTMPPPDRSPLAFPSTSLAASFSTAFSNDGMKYAVASQEGVVAIWDVRSTKTLKVFQTDKGRLPSEGGHWTGGWLSDDPYEWTRGNSKAPGWSVRNVKFGNGGGNGIGREIMTFTEHTSFLHVIDARTFETEEIIRIPPVPTKSSVNSSQRQVPSRTPSQQNLHSSAQSRSRSRALVSRPYQRPLRSTNPRHVAVSATSHLGGGNARHDSTMPPYVVLALEDTFRISPRGSSDVSPPTSRALWRSRRYDSATERLNDGDSGYNDRYIPSSASRDDEEDLVVIPPFGDREVEENVRVLLNYHSLGRARTYGTWAGSRSSANDREDGDSRDAETADERDRMDVDDRDFEMEAEWDCVSSHVPSRSSTPPPPPSNVSATGRSNASGGNLHRWRSWARLSREEIQDTTEDPEGAEEAPVSVEHKYYDLDIAGTCFDPSGSRIYVATTESVSEWTIRGGEKRWWADSGADGVWC